MNPMELLKYRQYLNDFNNNHPKVAPYLKTVVSQGYVRSGSVLELNVTNPDGKSLKCNIRLTDSDIEMIRKLGEYGGNK